MRTHFSFFASFYDAICDLDEQDQLNLFRAICDYGLFEKEPIFSGQLKPLWKIIKPNILSCHQRQDDGKRGGRPPKNQEDKKLLNPPLNPPFNPALKQKERIEDKGMGKEKINFGHENENFKVTEPALWLTLLQHFGFESEMNFISKHIEINFFLNTLKKEKRLDFFVTQFRAYWNYCQKKPAYKQSYVRFIHQAGWNDESWEQKMKDLKAQQKKDFTPTLLQGTE